MRLLRSRRGESVRDSTTVISSLRPSWARRVIWFSCPLLIITGGAILFAVKELDISGRALWAVAGIAAAVSAAIGLRSLLVGVKVGADGITVVNAYRTIQIPYGEVHAFEWSSPSPGYRPWRLSGKGLQWDHTPIGLSVVWGRSDGRHGVERTFVDAFNRRGNPTADLVKGYEAWNRLQSSRAIKLSGSPQVAPPD